MIQAQRYNTPHGHDGWVGYLKRKGYLWEHDGNPQRPVALLSSGSHSNFYFDGKRFQHYEPAMACEAVSQLMRIVPDFYFDWVVGPETGARGLAKDIGNYTGKPWCTLEKGIENGRKVMTIPDVCQIKTGQIVLLCEDTITSPAREGTVGRCMEALENAGVIVADQILAICNRSPVTEFEGKTINCLLRFDNARNWQSGEDPLKIGYIEALKPREGNNWKILTKEYC